LDGSAVVEGSERRVRKGTVRTATPCIQMNAPYDLEYFRGGTASIATEKRKNDEGRISKFNAQLQDQGGTKGTYLGSPDSLYSD
jgi:hypothetical protein